MHASLKNKILSRAAIAIGCVFVFTLFFNVSLFSQVTFPVNGVHDEIHNFYAFTNASIFIDYKTRIDSATLLIRDGRVEKAGRKVPIPPNTVVYDLNGKFIYPSFIDLFSSYGMPDIRKKNADEPKPGMERNSKGPLYWNEAIKPEVKASAMFSVNKKEAEELRKLGFGVALTHQMDGIARGTSALVTLADKKENEVMLLENAAAQYSFSKGVSVQNYPSSLMGSIALLRQTYYDAQWYSSLKALNKDEGELNISLENFNINQKLPQIFEAGDYLTVLRADRAGDEFGIQYIIKGAGDEYKRLKEIKETDAKLIIPLKFPKPFDVEDAYDALQITLEELKHWEQAPANPAFLEKKGIEFSITAGSSEERKNFWKNMLRAKKYGLSDTAALKALTLLPAQMLGMDKKIGALREGMFANFIISSGNIFNEKNKLYENWVQGERYIISNYDIVDARGSYDLNIDSALYELKVEGKLESPDGKIKSASDTNNIKAKITVDGNLVSLVFDLHDGKYKGMVRLSGKINYQGGSWDGQGQVPGGAWVFWNAIRKEKFKEREDTVKKDTVELGSVFYPNQAFGFETMPVARATLIKNATVWTNEKEGVLKNSDVFISGGKIIAVGYGLQNEKLFSSYKDSIFIIDGTGKHVTAGIIDEHSHIAISKGVNEFAQAVSAEVRIGDVINPDDVNIYRQLAGGVTASHLLHGSANPVGGQSAIIKLKWGFSPEEMKIRDAVPFIKFALGENVKQSNAGDFNNFRFPQTRMGVEQVYMDAFTRAREYKSAFALQRIDQPGKKKPKSEVEKKSIHVLRKDLELEALVEILENKRFITCHSYIQSEINMLMHVADSFGFKINTFTHILEGYKIADKIKKHGAGASSFSDWWAYKFEVNDAIPYNGSILHEQGLTVAYNSDDAEMGRRLNQEAAKAIKYGGVSDEEALKFVTLNPAKLLKLDSTMGSIKAGKDADLVLWSDHPLSIYAKTEKTYIDGILFYDAEKDVLLQKLNQAERVRLIAKMIKAKNSGEETRKPEKKEQKNYHCDTIEE